MLCVTAPTKHSLQLIKVLLTQHTRHLFDRDVQSFWL